MDTDDAVVIALSIALFFAILLFPIYVTLMIIWGAAIYIAINNHYEKRPTIQTAVPIILAGLLTFYCVKSVFGLTLYYSLAISVIDILEGMGLMAAIFLYLEYIWVLLLFIVPYGIFFVYSLLTRNISYWKWGRWILLFGIVLYFVLILVDFLSIGDTTEMVVKIIILGLAIPFEMYYIIEFAIWIMGAYTFITLFLGHLVGEEDEA